MVLLRWLAFSILLFVGAWVIIANWVIPLRRGGGSLIPIIGGVFVAIAFAVVPVDTIRWLWWVPLIVDLGCLPILLLATGAFIWRTVSRRPE
jgi:hypothetical protein